ncbi:unnamed protein product, partial [Adineta ricciae]
QQQQKKDIFIVQYIFCLHYYLKPLRMADDQEEITSDCITRFIDTEYELSTANTPVIDCQDMSNVSYEDTPIVSIEEAVEPLASLVPDIQRRTEEVKSRCPNPPPDELTLDESVSIRLYSLQWIPSNKSLYNILNLTLRSKDIKQLKPWFRYLKLLLTALERLPTKYRTVYRGVKLDLHAGYHRRSVVEWWAFSSCSSRIGVLKHELFLGKTGERTIFSIECESGKNIEKHSAFASETEIVLLPGTQFEVIDSLDLGSGLHLIQLCEQKTSRSLLHSLLTTNLSSTPEGKMVLYQFVATHFVALISSRSFRRFSIRRLFISSHSVRRDLMKIVTGICNRTEML